MGLAIARKVLLVALPVALLSSEDASLLPHILVRSFRCLTTFSILAGNYYLKLPNDGASYSAWSELHKFGAKRLLSLCEKNGGIFIKLGQHLAALDHVIPAEYVSMLSCLFSNAPQTETARVKQVIKEELGVDPDSIFSSFSENPIGSASIAQVHIATLRESGERVAVKVQHPSLKKLARWDILVAGSIFRCVRFIFPHFTLNWLAEEMEKNISAELDFNKEASNCERAKIAFSDCGDKVLVPTVYRTLSTSRLLVMQHLTGFSPLDKKELKKFGISKVEACDRIAWAFSRMLFRDGYVHCDPHPGNILICPTSDGNWRLGILDHGLYRQVSHSLKFTYAEIWRNLVFFNEQNLRRLARSVSVDGQNFQILAAIVGEASFGKLRCTNLLGRSTSESKDLQRQAIENVQEIVSILSSVPRDLLLIFKTNNLIRNIERSLTHTASIPLFVCNILEQGHQFLLKNSSGLSLARLSLALELIWIKLSSFLNRQIFYKDWT